MRLIIAGSRSFNNYELLAATLDELTVDVPKEKLVVLSGHARGADQLGERWSRERYVWCEFFHPDWQKHGKAAGHVRNAAMVASCDPGDAAVFFWDGQSPGTKGCIELARKAGLKVTVIQVQA